MDASSNSFIIVVIIVVVVLFSVAFMWHINKPVIDYESAESVCGRHLMMIYSVITEYGEENTFLPSDLQNEDSWAKPFFENAGLGSEERKWLICPADKDIELFRDGKILRQKIDPAKPWYSSYQFNMELLGKKWESIRDLEKIPLLIEKKPNHNDKFLIFYTNGDLELTDSLRILKRNK